MAKETISVRVTQATYEEFEEYRHEQGTDTEPLSKADAGRKLIESGLTTEQSPPAARRGAPAPATHTDTDADTDTDTETDANPRGPLTVFMSLAGDSLRDQLDALGWWVAFTGLFVFFSTQLPGGPIWLIPAVVLGLASASTLVLGIGLGLIDQLDPDPKPRDGTGSSDEVEQ